MALVAAVHIFASILDSTGFPATFRLPAISNQLQSIATPQPALKQKSSVPSYSSNLKVAICTSIKKEKPVDMEEWVQYYRCAAQLEVESCDDMASSTSSESSYAVFL